jgi:PAS domain S-box-containing protein
MTEKITYGARWQKPGEQEGDDARLLTVRAALQEGEENYRKLLDLSPDSVVILQDGKYQFVSSAFTKMFGYSREDIARGLSFFELVRAEDLDAVRRRYTDRMAGKPVPNTFRINLVAKDSSLIPCETCATLINFNGRPADLVFIRDISERIMAEKAVRTNEETLRALLDSTHDLALLVAEDGTVLTANNKAAQRYDKDLEGLIGSNIYPLMPPDMVELRKNKAAEVIDTKQPVRYTEEIAGKYFDCNLFPILDEAGNVRSFTVFARDITERQQNHKAMQNVRQELEHRVKERTKELEEKAEKLEEVNTALKVLLKRLDEDKKAIDEKVLFNVQQLVEPNLEKLKTGR